MEEELLSKEKLIKDIETQQITSDDLEDEDEEIIIDKDKRNLVTEKADPDVDSLFGRWKKGSLILRPKFQRNYVMKNSIANKLIESLLLGVPLPIFYFAEEPDGKKSVIDGQQRLTAIFSFIDGEIAKEITKDGGKIKSVVPFKLSGLKVLKEYNNKTFNDLPEEMQGKILDTTLRVITIKKESDPDLKFEIFERLNTGSTPLNEDEIRNNIYRGEFIDLLAELEENKDFNNLINKPNFKNRMLYRGMILRFLAFYERTYLNYKPSMKQFCNNFLEENRHLSKEKADKYRQVFKDTLSLVNSVFGDCAFKRFAKDEKSNNYSWIKTRINMALFDIEMWGFVKYKKEQVYNHLEEIKEAMIDLMTRDQDFVDSIQLKTSNTDMVEYRFRKWESVLKNIITEKATPRLYTYEQKQELYGKNQTCALCHQHINSIDDAHVDHILAKNNGGATTLENAQITHRWCNLHKSDN